MRNCAFALLTAAKVVSFSVLKIQLRDSLIDHVSRFLAQSPAQQIVQTNLDKEIGGML